MWIYEYVYDKLDFQVKGFFKEFLDNSPSLLIIPYL
jgi:hypothetical protein